MKVQKIFIFLLMFSILFLASCSKDENPTEPGDGGTQGTTNKSGQPMPAFANDAAGVMATINYEFQTAPGFPAANISLAFAQFGDGADAGNVSVNGNAIGKTTQSSTTFYVVPSPSSPTQTLSGVNFNGSNHSWQVSGGNGIPSMNGSVNSPSNFSLSSPANNASVNKSSGLNVTWTNTSSSRVLVLLAAINSSNQYYAKDDLDDNGSFTIPSSELSSFSGDAMLQVVKYNYSGVSAGGSDYYVISEIVKSVTVKIN